MPAVLLATCAELPDGDEDAELLDAALRRLGLDPRWAVWTDRTVDWTAGLVVLRSTWDYTLDRSRFLTWTGAVPRLLNPAHVVAWNTDKQYLRDLAAAGVPVVASRFAAPGDELALFDAIEIVVKPSVGAGSRGAGRFGPDRHAAARAHAATLHDAGRVVLVQPYLDAVEESGETALIYLDGRFSHAARKGALLPDGRAHPIDGEVLFVQESMAPRVPSADELAVGDAAVAAVHKRFGDVALYARVDLLPSADGPVVVELELAEPSLFLQYAAGAADRFAAAIAARV